MTKVKTSDQKRVGEFIEAVYTVYKDLYFTYLEVNPLVVKPDGIYVLDLAAKIDQTAEFLCSSKWGKIGFPPPFGREAFPEVRSTFYFNIMSTFLFKILFQHFISIFNFNISFQQFISTFLFKIFQKNDFSFTEENFKLNQSFSFLGSIHCRIGCEKWSLS